MEVKPILRLMSDENAVKFRQRLIDKGILTPSPIEYGMYERPIMSKDVTLRLKATLIKAGLLSPGTGTIRVKPRAV